MSTTNEFHEHTKNKLHRQVVKFSSKINFNSINRLLLGWKQNITGRKYCRKYRTNRGKIVYNKILIRHIGEKTEQLSSTAEKIEMGSKINHNFYKSTQQR